MSANDPSSAAMQSLMGRTARTSSLFSSSVTGPSSLRTMRVGLLGCGRMGAAMGGHLLDAGTELAVYDPAPEACAALVARGALACSGAADVAARSELVLVVVVDDEQTREAVEACLE